MGRFSIWTAISRAQVEVWPQWKKKNGAPNNVSSQTKNYEIIPFILGTLGWHRVEVKGEVQTRKGLWWIPRHPETRKGVLSDEMLRGVAKNQRSEDSRIGVKHCFGAGRESGTKSRQTLNTRYDPDGSRKSSNDLQQEGTCTGNRHRWCRKVKEVGDLMTGKPATEAPVNGGRNYNGPKVAKFLVGLGGRQRRPPSGGARAISLPKGNRGVQRFPRARRRLALECKGRRELDCKTHPLIFPKSSHRREGLAPRCRLFATWSCSRFQGLGCSPIKAVRELGSEHRETVRSISGVGVRALRGPFPSTRGPGRTHLWCASYRANGKRWVANPTGTEQKPYGDGAKEVYRIEGHGETSRFSLTIGVKWKCSN
ncbi:hypothetical protein RYX36_021970, partial [Vicia faba]